MIQNNLFFQSELQILLINIIRMCVIVILKTAIYVLHTMDTFSSSNFYYSMKLNFDQRHLLIGHLHYPKSMYMHF